MLILQCALLPGTYRSRTLQAPEGLATRPTSDRLRETVFNVLAPRIEGARFLDLYAGSGAVGIEALSRARRMLSVVSGLRWRWLCCAGTWRNLG